MAGQLKVIARSSRVGCVVRSFGSEPRTPRTQRAQIDRGKPHHEIFKQKQVYNPIPVEIP